MVFLSLFPEKSEIVTWSTRSGRWEQMGDCPRAGWRPAGGLELCMLLWDKTPLLARYLQDLANQGFTLTLKGVRWRVNRVISHSKSRVGKMRISPSLCALLPSNSVVDLFFFKFCVCNMLFVDSVSQLHYEGYDYAWDGEKAKGKLGVIWLFSPVTFASFQEG